MLRSVFEGRNLIVRCENCQSEFSLEDAQVPHDGMTVRCSVCAYVFKVEPTGAPTETGWQIRTTDDMLFTSPDIDTMVRWIEEGRLHPDDSVSRTGRNWLRIGDMAELSHLFDQSDAVPVFTPVVAPAERSAEKELGPVPTFGGARDAAESAPVVRGESGLLGVAGLDQPAVGAPKASPSGLLQSGPVTRGTVPPADASSAVASGVVEASGPPPAAATLPRPVVQPAVASPAPLPEKSGRTSPVLVAILAIGVVGGIAMGVPSIRNAILQIPETVEARPGAGNQRGAAAADQSDEGRAKQDVLVGAKASLVHLGVSAVGDAEIAIQKAVDGGEVGAEEYQQMRLMQAELFSSRGLAYEMAAAATEDDIDKAGLREKAKADSEKASGIAEDFGENTPKGSRLQSIRALVRLLEGAGAEEVAGLLPDEGAQEAHLIVKGASVWRDANPQVKRQLVRDLEEIDKPSGLEQSLLALALLHSDDPEGAREIAKHLEAQADDSPVAVAVLASLGREEVADTEKSATEGGEDPPGDRVADGAADTGDDGKSEPVAVVKKKKKAGGGGGGGSLDALISKGCGQVRSGKYAAGVKTMLKAFDRAPGDLDVMVCLAEGYEGMGSASSAATFYERVLKRSPNHRVALRKSAALSAKRGSVKKALKLYEKLLKLEPGNTTAKAYVDKHAKPAPAPAGGGTTPLPPSGGTTPAPPAGGTTPTPPAGGPSGGATPPAGTGG